MNGSSAGLWASYLSHGLPFAIMHLVCAGYVCHLIAGLARERAHLVAWLEHGSTDVHREGSVVRMFQEFVESTKQLGPKGETVDAGEHLQRIEDAVARKEAHLSDSVHWFLLIGIAGTLYGLFGFAVQMKALENAQPAELVKQVGTQLAGAMGKAFPVGLVGLILLIVFQFLSSLVESRLDDAVGVATSRVLRLRREVTVAQTQFIDAVRDSIRDSMEPLNHLRSVLEQSLQPVIAAFKDSLDDALELVRLQMTEMQRFVGDVPEIQRGFVTAAAQVREASVALTRFAETFTHRLDAIDKQSEALQRTAHASMDLSTRLINQSQAQQAKIETMRLTSDLTLESAAVMTDRVADLVENIQTASQGVAQIPAVLQASLELTMPRLVDVAGDRLLSEWEKATRDMSRDLGAGVAHSVGEVIEGIGHVVAQMQVAMSEWERVNRNVDSLVRDSIDQAMKTAMAPNREMALDTKALAAEVKSVISTRQSTVTHLEAAIVSFTNVLTSIQTQMEPITASFDRSASRIAVAARAIEKAAVALPRLGASNSVKVSDPAVVSE